MFRRLKFAVFTAFVLLSACGGGDTLKSINNGQRETALASTVVPENGVWWNAAESGCGFTVDVQGTQLALGMFMYESSGSAVWYAGVLAQQPDNAYAGSVSRFSGGQTLAGSYKAPTGSAVAATVKLQFDSAKNGLLSVTPPAGAVSTISIQRFVLTSGSSQTPTPALQSGIWWNADESGRGFFIDSQGDRVSIGSYMYDESGQPVWYTTTGSMQSDGRTFSGAMQQFVGGQSLGGSYKLPTLINGNVGTLSLVVQSATTATLTLPNGRALPLTRFGFGTGTAPSVINEASCKTYLATSLPGVVALSGNAATQRASMLADGGKIVPLNKRYYTVWIPPGFYADSSASVVYGLPGTSGYPEAEWNDWHSPMASRNHALIGLHWGGGTPSAESDETIYSQLLQIKTEVAKYCPTTNRKHWLMGFSVGSAMSFAIMVRDTAGAKAFMRQLAVSGASISPLETGMSLLHSTVESARSNSAAVSGVKSWMYCGEKDLDHTWSMCLEMPLGQDFINTHGGAATLYKDPNGSHGSLPTSAAAYADMFTYMSAN